MFEKDEFKVGDFFYYIRPERLYQLKDIKKDEVLILGFGKEKNTYKIPINYHKSNFYGGKNAGDWHKAKLEEIPVENLSNEELLEIAKQYYPVGTKFKSPVSGQIFTVAKNSHRLADNFIVDVLEEYKINNYKGCLFRVKTKEWAEIISTTQEVKDDFVLPEKWCIRITNDNYKELNNYFDRGYSFKQYIRSFIHVFNNNFQYYGYQSFEYTEITTEQFKKYVLGENLIVKTKVSDVDINTKVFKNSEEIYIPTITKQNKKIDYTINSVFADIKINLPEKPKKIVKPIVLEKFNLII